MKAIITLLITALSMPLFARPGIAPVENGQRILAIIQFLQEHRDELALPNQPGVHPTKDGILGSKEDEFTYRIPNGLSGVVHENLKQLSGAKGWYYLATVKSFKASERAEARAAAQVFASTFSRSLTADGYTLSAPNPWPTIVYHKPVDSETEVRIWVSYYDDPDGTWVMLQIALSPTASFIKIVR